MKDVLKETHEKVDKEADKEHKEAAKELKAAIKSDGAKSLP